MNRRYRLALGALGVALCACPYALADTVMIDATHLKAHRTAVSLLKMGLFLAVSGERRAA